ncbi:MAG: rRNA maturation RNase YbeY [Candidatus Magasanikbacteria bacterium]|nr:rRNA maturation RNase YbeY [Candidatus Magasanikbacteria bacterium]
MITASITRLVKTPVTARHINKVATTASRAEAKIHGAVDIILVGRERMRRLNKQFRGLNRPTDVLSFAWNEDKAYRGNNLGEIYLCPAVLLPQAKKWKVSFREEFSRMLVHGLLHLVGYDHDSEKKANVMFALQEKIVKTSV